MKFGGIRNREKVLIVDITPMIDVVFLLIIFFMVAAQFARTTRAEMDLPLEPGEQEQQAEEAGLVINVLADGSIIVNEQTLDLDQLEAMVRDEVQNVHGGDAKLVKLLIRSDRNNDTSRLNQILNRLETLGVGAARLATEVPR
ncbi:MAG: biopolymer transporter ExbD [Planctomycetota bacterium]|nr:biopolymer transporter ExbD [Planctomycetota bacterium]